MPRMFFAFVVTDRRLSRRDSGLAWIEFVDGEPLHELTVSIGAVHDLLAQGSWRGRPFAALPPAATRTFVQRAMGRAIAHEIWRLSPAQPRARRPGADAIGLLDRRHHEPEDGARSRRCARTRAEPDTSRTSP
ncbi:MAG: hypothetical protein QM736_11020 [Vicinamibacterales bacterium]